MSLRSKILLLTVPAVFLLVATLSALLLNNLIESHLQNSRRMAEFAIQQTKEVLLLRLEDASKQGAGSREAWKAAIADDKRLAQMLVNGVAQSSALVEISIAGDDGRILVSSTDGVAGTVLRERRPLHQLLALGPLDRIRSIRGDQRDYELRIPIGLLNDPRPIFTIQVLVSMVLVSNLISGGLQWIGMASLITLAVALVFVSLLAGFVSRNLRQIETGIDLIRQGEPVAAAPRASTPEFAAVQSKLKLLGAEMRDTARTAADFRSRVSEVLERLEEGILLFDAGGKLILSGGAAERMLGRPPSSLQIDETPLAGLLREAAESRANVEERLIEWPDGSGGASALFAAVDYFPDARRLVRLRDPEARKQLESQIELLSRLDSINRLTGGVAHEIKNPLNSIAAHLALLDSIVSPSSEEAEEEVRVITEEVERLDRVVRTFLDFTRPVELNQERLDIAQLVSEVAAWIRPDAEGRTVTVGCDCTPDTIWLWGDADILRQALMNLAVNALDAMPQGGSLSLRVNATGRQFVEVLVADTGTGIPREQVDKIFQLYFTTKKHGSGIGLAMVYRAVQLHGGSIKVESELGRGTRFILSFPALAEA